MKDSPKCIKCEHYYVTWDKVFPYGCRAMGFKTYKIPSAVVRESSGRDCLAFAERQKRE
ncbi:uracil-DNA glycosylase [Sporomusa acidovorans]|uniref:Uracil-DNA glycosylase n=1 Tax=Sporomusa acidovorans (strain ATCC 49682 / DSM 3132 / Mol) TaxID=1123286 RepID=A0ABZ3JB53_SPOA4|nr:uracil-DNA glycosylase [Sporomusa acidovorans]OZC13342.1 hypothetical protein SPACI_58380 [Sporomusa acidovorans DSM 3132]SDD95803.1 hypothetical protein SAMN04488499_100610 [Sporomusa acidovorans]